MPTYDSATDLGLGQVPQVADPILYEELLDIHNALEALLKGNDDIDAIFLAFLAKFRSVREVATDYLVDISDGTITVDASLGDIVITLHEASLLEGSQYNVKRIDNVPSFTVILVGHAAELIDGHVGGIKISTKSSYTVKSKSNGWIII